MSVMASIHHLQCSEPANSQHGQQNELTPEIDHQNCQWLGQTPTMPTLWQVIPSKYFDV